MLIFEIHSKPVPQKQTRLSRHHMYNPSKKDEQQIQWQIRPHAPENPIQVPIEMHITFYFEVPKGTSKKRKEQMLNGRMRHIVRPDVDNLAYLVTNALKGIVYKDDSQIDTLILKKRYGEKQKTIIEIIPWEE